MANMLSGERRRRGQTAEKRALNQLRLPDLTEVALILQQDDEEVEASRE